MSLDIKSSEPETVLVTKFLKPALHLPKFYEEKKS